MRRRARIAVLSRLARAASWHSSRASGAQFAPDRSQTLLLVDGDELDARQIADQLGLEAADDPSDARIRTMRADAVHQRQHVRDVAEGGQAENADRFDGCAHVRGLVTLRS